jgi:electron transfer flavoprotein beta subunit
MTVKGINEYDKKPLEIYDFDTLKDDPLIEKDTIGLQGSPTNVFRSFTPPQKGAGMMLQGAEKEAVSQLYGILTQKHLI